MAKEKSKAARDEAENDAEREAGTTTKPAKPTSENVHEFVLYRRSGETRIPLMSDHDLDVVKSSKISAISQALAAGQARPDLFIVDRDVTYPLSGNGQREAHGSTCEEREI